jgi:transposase
LELFCGFLRFFCIGQIDAAHGQKNCYDRYMDKTRAKFRYTTFEQRKLLFEIWEATSNVTLACGKAHVGRRTFYNWKARFDQLGYAGVEEFASRARLHPRCVAPFLKKRVLEHHEANPSWGKLRIAQELAKENNWVVIISPNTVRHILQESGKWNPPIRVKKNELTRIEQPNKPDKPSI